MTQPVYNVPPTPTPSVRLIFTWGVTDGSAPETVEVEWLGTVPSIDALTSAVEALALTGNRYEVASVDELREQQPLTSLMDECGRPSCGHYRAKHTNGKGSCSICMESTVCPSFREPLSLAPTVDG
jgi:hypothetical protein